LGVLGLLRLRLLNFLSIRAEAASTFDFEFAFTQLTRGAFSVGLIICGASEDNPVKPSLAVLYSHNRGHMNFFSTIITFEKWHALSPLTKIRSRLILPAAIEPSKPRRA
jgi:hypothetical protein